MGKATQLVYFVDASPAAVAERAAAYIANRIEEAAAARGKARVAVSGGRTPRAAFELLAAPPYRQKVPWEKLELYWVDERVVPPDDPDSNYRMTRLALLQNVPLREAQIFRIRGELDAEAAADAYESDIRRSFRLEGAEIPVFDAIGLGMGPDGHTASLFPHSAALDETMRIAVANHVPEQKNAWRVTLTWPVINQARDVFFLVEGADKADVLRRVFQGDLRPEELPSQLIQPGNGRLTLLLDAAAAALLPRPGPAGEGRLEIRR